MDELVNDMLVIVFTANYYAERYLAAIMLSFLVITASIAIVHLLWRKL